MNFALNRTYDFNIDSGGEQILGASYENMRVTAIMTANEACSVSSDITSTHDRLIRKINALPKSINDCTFIRFEKQDVAKTKVILAIEYIDPHSIVEVTTTNILARFVNVTSADLAKIRKICLENGYTNITLETYTS